MARQISPTTQFKKPQRAPLPDGREEMPPPVASARCRVKPPGISGLPQGQAPRRSEQGGRGGGGGAALLEAQGQELITTLSARELPATWPVPRASARCLLVSEPGPAPPHPRGCRGQGTGYGLPWADPRGGFSKSPRCRGLVPHTSVTPEPTQGPQEG